MECDNDKGEALVQVRSKYNKKNGDRQFKWNCRQVTEGKVPLTDCEWSKEVNKWNGPISFTCPKNKVMAGIRSKNHESKMDRKWKVKCCKAEGHITKSCGASKKLNSYHGTVDYAVSHDGADSSVFSGIQSLENIKKLVHTCFYIASSQTIAILVFLFFYSDREWKVFECDFGTPKCTQKTTHWPSTYPQNPNAPLPDNHYPYNIVLDLNKLNPSTSSPPPKSPTYTIHAPSETNDGHYTIELDPTRANEVVNGMNHIVQKDESLIGHKKNRPPRLLPVPPGTSKHPDISLKHRKNSPTESLSNNDHIIEILPRSHSNRKNTPSYSLQYKRPIPNQSKEHHFHIYPPPGNSPGLFTVYPNPISGAPKVHFTEPPKPPQRTHYHVQLPSDESKLPKDLHYDVPMPSDGNGIKYKVPLSTPNANKKPKRMENTIEGLLRELAKKGTN